MSKISNSSFIQGDLEKEVMSGFSSCLCVFTRMVCSGGHRQTSDVKFLGMHGEICSPVANIYW